MEENEKNGVSNKSSQVSIKNNSILNRTYFEKIPLAVNATIEERTLPFPSSDFFETTKTITQEDLQEAAENQMSDFFAFQAQNPISELFIKQLNQQDIQLV